MKLTTAELIKVIHEHKGWIEANSLADYFDVSTRTIRKRVKEINTSHPNLIISSYKGYKINDSDYEYNAVETEDELSSRTNYIMRKLIVSSKPLSVYDLADELHISDSSFERSLKIVKENLNYFDLQISRKRNTIQIDGKERNKRKLINYLISKENSDGFFSSDYLNNELIVEDVDTEEIKEAVKELFNKHGVYINDYGFQTVIFHIVIMLDRVMQGKYVVGEEVFTKVTEDMPTLRIVEDLQKYLESTYNIKLPELELYYLSIIISNNSNIYDLNTVNESNIMNYVEQEYIDLVKKIFNDLANNYSLEPFSEKFLVNITIHIRSLIVRIKNGTYTQNPLTGKFQNQYPIIYDMATFIAKEIYDYTGIKIIDDEIAFIAFHIGSTFENHKILKEKIKACFVYSDYHSFHLNSINKIADTFDSELYVSSVMSINDFTNQEVAADMIISTENIETDIPFVPVSIFINEIDIKNIRELVDKIKVQRKRDNLRKDLNHFIGEKLFKKEFYCTDNVEMINYLANECIEIGLCNKDFINEVLERESLSSTSFRNAVAIPHSLKASTKHSFMSVVLNSKKMLWGKNYVNIIILLGTSKNDRERFKNVYDELAQILYEPANIKRLIKCNGYDEFLNKLVDMIS